MSGNLRVIPAWAGNTSEVAPRVAARTGHPRVGGEHIDSVFARRQRERVIPAWAGNTAPGSSPSSRPSGHPRVGGEHYSGTDINDSDAGSSPRGRGTLCTVHLNKAEARVIPAWAGNTPRCPFSISSPAGSSPRGRGTHGRPHARRRPWRVIPAWAGNTVAPSRRGTASSGHPRVGGEHSSCAPSYTSSSGSSPRGRGTLIRPGNSCRVQRVIPAWAGNT